jgi:Kef-type K+ transport system membrane component KefB
MIDNAFYVVAAVLALATVAGFVAMKLRQPLIVSFILVGIAVGPAALGWVESTDEIEIFAELGIVALLFLVGLKLDLHLIRSTGPVALATGLGQVVFTSTIGFGLALALGLSPVNALYVAVALTFSSTIIIVKLLSDKREIDDLHGRIAVGFLIVQDIVVVLVIIALSAFGGSGSESIGVEVGLVLSKGVAFLGGIALVARYLFPWLLPRLAGSKDLLVLAAIAWAVALAALGDWLGFSKEVGAFLGGVSLAGTPYREAVGARLVGLRDFLLLFFFIELGAGLDFTDAGSQIGPAVVLSAFVLLGNPLIVLVIMGAMGYRKRTSFLAGLTVAQISEFSLVLVALGLGLGQIGQSTVGLVTLVGVITITLSTYMILYSQQLFDRLAPLLSVFEREHPRPADGDDGADDVDVIVVGSGRFGSRIVQELLDEGTRVMVIDQDPQALARMERAGVRTLFGDAGEPELALALPLGPVRWVVSTVPDVDVSLALVHGLREARYEGKVAATSHVDLDTERLEEAGVDVVLHPFHAAAEHGTSVLLDTPPAP